MADSRPLCIVTGLSGAGKSTALAAFEDLGFFTVDGLPAGLSPEMAAMMDSASMGHYRGMAVAMDLRESGFLAELERALPRLHGPTLLFLDASDADLLKRYAFTRRLHPLERDGLGLAQAIGAEREQLQPLKRMAHLVLDTTGFNVHDLRRAINARFRDGQLHRHDLRLNVLSFGYKHGLPRDADYVFDLRFLPNPYFEPKLRALSGLDAPVRDYVLKAPETEKLFAQIMALLGYALPHIEASGRGRVTIALGCTGGRHRSVALAEKLAGDLGQLGWPATLEHRNLTDTE